MKPLLRFSLLLAVSAPLVGVGKDQDKTFTSRNTNISVFSSLSYAPYNFERKEGLISTGKSFEQNFGASLSKDYYFKFLPVGSYLSFGLRYNRATFKSYSRTKIEGFTPESGEDVSVLYEFVTVPVYFGQTYKHTFLGSLNIYGGLAAGISSNGMGTTHQHIQKSEANSERVYLTNDPWLDIGPYKPHLTADVGIRFYPFRNLRNLGFGLTFSQDLLKPYPVYREGIFGNSSQNKQEHYEYSVTRRFSNLFLSVTYSFGRKWER